MGLHIDVWDKAWSLPLVCSFEIWRVIYNLRSKMVQFRVFYFNSHAGVKLNNRTKNGTNLPLHLSSKSQFKKSQSLIYHNDGENICSTRHVGHPMNITT